MATSAPWPATAFALLALRRGEAEYGIKPRWALECFKDPYQDVRQSLSRLHRTAYLPHKEHIRGFVYDVADGLLHEVAADPRHVGLERSALDA